MSLFLKQNCTDSPSARLLFGEKKCYSINMDLIRQTLLIPMFILTEKYLCSKHIVNSAGELVGSI